MSEGLVIGLGIVAIATTGVLRIVVESIGIEGYTGLVVGLVLLWICFLTTIVSAIRLARRPRAAQLEK